MSIQTYRCTFDKLPLHLQQTITCSDPKTNEFLVVDIDGDVTVFEDTLIERNQFEELHLMLEKAEEVAQERDEALSLLDFLVSALDGASNAEMLETVIAADPDLSLCLEEIRDFVDGFLPEDDDTPDQEDLNPASNTPLPFH